MKIGPLEQAAAPKLFGFEAGIWRVPRVLRWVEPTINEHTKPGVFRAALAWNVLAASHSLADLERRLKDYALNGFLKRQKARGATIIITLDPMPRWLARNKSDKALPDGPAWAKSVPSDLGTWSEVVERVVRHLDSALGLSAYYEVWNEPDWAYPSQDYVALYHATVHGARLASNSAKIAAPALSDWASSAEKGNTSFWLREFLRLIAKEGLRLDALTWHAFYRDPSEHYDLVVPTIRAWLGESGYAGIPLIVDEWNIAAEPPYPEGDLNGSFIGAAYVSASLIAMARNGIDLQSFQRIVDPGAKGYSGGAFTVTGVPRPSFHAFRLFGQMEGRRARVDIASPFVQAAAYATDQRLYVLVAVMVPTDGMIARNAFERLAKIDVAGLRALQNVGRNSLASYVFGKGKRPDVGARGAPALDRAIKIIRDHRTQRDKYREPFDLVVDLRGTVDVGCVLRYELVDRSHALSTRAAKEKGASLSRHSCRDKTRRVRSFRAAKCQKTWPSSGRRISGDAPARPPSRARAVSGPCSRERIRH